MLEEIVLSRFFESDHNNLTQKLLYENLSYDEAIDMGIGKLLNLDLF